MEHLEQDRITVGTERSYPKCTDRIWKGWDRCDNIHEKAQATNAEPGNSHLKCIYQIQGERKIMFMTESIFPAMAHIWVDERQSGRLHLQ